MPHMKNKLDIFIIDNLPTNLKNEKDYNYVFKKT